MTTLLIAGRGPLAIAIAHQLRATSLDVVRLRGDEADEKELDPAQLASASVLVLAANDDSGNVDFALRVRREFPALPLVVRLFDTGLADYLRGTIPGVTVLSMAMVAAPAFADAAQRLLASPSKTRPQRPRTRRRSFRPDRVLLTALVSLLLLVFPSAYLFSRTLGLRYIDALYFVWTTVMTVGYGDIALRDAPDGIKLFGMVLMLAGASFIAVLFALLSEWVLSRRLNMVRGRTRVRGGGHALIIGAGNLGLRIAELLGEAGHRRVIVERDAELANVAVLRSMSIHTIIADATNEDMLELAGIDSAAVVIAVTDVDAVNLQIALHARERGARVIMRVLSPELSSHVSERGEWLAFSPVVAAAEAFASAAIQATNHSTASSTIALA